MLPVDQADDMQVRVGRSSKDYITRLETRMADIKMTENWVSEGDDGAKWVGF